MIHNISSATSFFKDLLLVLLVFSFVGNTLTPQTTANCPDNIPISQMSLIVQSNRFQKVINQLNVLSPKYEQKIKDFFYQNQNSNSLNQSTQEEQTYFLLIAYGISFFICFVTFRICFAKKNKKSNVCNFYCWQVFGAFLLIFILIFLVILMSFVLYNLIPQIKQQLKYSKCSLFNSLDTVLYGNIDEKWTGFGTFYKQYERVNKSNQKIYTNFERQESKMLQINQIIDQLRMKQESSSLTFDENIPQNSRYNQKSNQIKAIEILDQLKEKINSIQQMEIKAKNSVLKIRSNFSQLAILQPIRQKMEILRRNLYQFDVYEYKGFNGSTVKRLEKLYFTIIAVSILIIIGIIFGGAFSKFQSLTFVKFGYWAYWGIFFCLIFVSFYSFLYWSFTFVTCSASSTAFKNQGNFQNFGKFYQPFKKLDSCFFGQGNFGQINLQIDSSNQISEIINTNSQYVQAAAQFSSLVEDWRNSLKTARAQGSSQEQNNFNVVLNEKLNQIVFKTSRDKSQQPSQSKYAIEKMRNSLQKIQEMKKNTNCSVFKKQLKFMQTTICDNLTVLQFNNFIFTLILMLILFVALLVIPFGINIIEQMKEAKFKTNKNPSISSSYLSVQKGEQEYQEGKTLQIIQQN